MWKFLHLIINKCYICRVHSNITSNTSHGYSHSCIKRKVWYNLKYT